MVMLVAVLMMGMLAAMMITFQAFVVLAMLAVVMMKLVMS